MAGTSEIEKLERRYAENPEGRYFAPLADAYRKAGQTDRALELVRAGLEKHPEYLSAHIVLGRCHLDKKDDEAAGQAFQRVLSLDSENIIALKSLAEIEERRGGLLQARQWLMKLLKVDPMNADAEADLQRLGGAIAEAPTAPMAAIPDEAVGPEVSFADVETARLSGPIEGIVPAEFQAPTGVEVAPPDVEIKPFDEGLAWGTGERSSRSVSAADVERALHEHEASLEAPSAEIAPVLAPGAEQAHVAPEAIPTEDAWMSGTAGDEWSGRASSAAPAPDLAGVDVPTDGETWELAPPEEPASVAGVWDLGPPEEPERVTEAVTAEIPTEAEPPAPDLAGLPIIMPEEAAPGAASQPAYAVAEAPEPAYAEPSAPAPMLTETMGDLYLRQGFRAEAAEVFRHLLGRRPDDPGLRAKLADAEAPRPVFSAAALGTESVAVWLRRMADSRVLPPASGAAPEPEAGPTPMEQAFGGEPAAESSREAAPEPVGEPTQPAAGQFSLDAIFGGHGASAAPAGQPAPPPPPTGTSFDEFFGAPPEQGSVRPETAAAPDAAPPDDDVGAFNTWLRGLKR